MERLLSGQVAPRLANDEHDHRQRYADQFLVQSDHSRGLVYLEQTLGRVSAIQLSQ